MTETAAPEVWAARVALVPPARTERHWLPTAKLAVQAVSAAGVALEALQVVRPALLAQMVSAVSAVLAVSAAMVPTAW